MLGQIKGINDVSPWLRRTGTNPLVALTPGESAAVMGVLALIGLATLPFTLFSGDLGRGVLYLAFLFYLFTLALPFVIKRFRAGIFHPLVFYVLWVGIRSLAEGQALLPVTGIHYHRALTGRYPGNLNLLMAESVMLDGVALLALYAGYVLAPKLRMPKMRVPKARGLAVKSALWVAVSSIGLVALVHIGGGWETVLMQRGIASDQRIAAKVGGQWNYLATVGVVAPIVWLACARTAVWRLTFWIVLIGALIVKFVATGSRGGTIIPLIMLGAIWVLHYKTVPYRAIGVGIVAALLLVGGLGQYRAALQQASSFDKADVGSGPIEWIAVAAEELQEKSGENSGQLGVLGRVPEQVPYLYGESYLSIPFIFIPSAVWGDKPDAAGKLNAIRIFDQPSTGIPPGPVGEAYWNFSYPGVIMIFLFYGVFLKLLTALYRANQSHPAVIVLFVYTLFYLQPHTPSIYGFFHAIVPALIILGSFVIRASGRTHFRAPRILSERRIGASWSG